MSERPAGRRPGAVQAAGAASTAAPHVASVVIHGHFYQPPREDPWLDEVPRQPGAAPYHDWNERVEAESYAPVVGAEILDGQGGVRRVMNCLEHMSFNFGPTLLSWLEAHRPETYQAVVTADGVGRARLGHGGALAMAFHHPILPLSTRRDKETEVRWGILDFRRRFGRDAEGMWLPETAVDEETLEVLAAEGIRFTILAPHQLRALPTGGRPGIYRTPSGDEITLFPYDGSMSHGVAFGEALGDAQAWADALSGVGSEEPAPPDLRLIATDGETYGHHRTFGEMALAAVLEKLDALPDLALTNLSAYLARWPATEEVELVAPSSWSCAHGVGRWKEDCSCRIDHMKPPLQGWRAPLRAALAELADGLHGIYEDQAPDLFPDPWAARDGYGAVAGSSDPGELRGWVLEQLLEAEDGRAPGAARLDRAVQLLEMERNALRLFTSCAWFFDDVSGVEPLQVLGYAARAIDLARSLGGAVERLEADFLARLAEAESSDPEAGDGRRLYLEDVLPDPPVTARVAASALRKSDLGARIYEVQAEGDTVTVRHRATGETTSYRHRDLANVEPTRP